MGDEVISKIIGKNRKPPSSLPTVILSNPKYSSNLGKVLRLASCYGINQVWYSGDRIRLKEGERLPREERMKGYKSVDLIQTDYPFDALPENTVPVAIEVRENSESLFEFQHPENAAYIFGQEDGGVPQTWLRLCHRFVVIPVRHCMNLATAVSTVLWDRELKRHQAGLIKERITPGVWENRGGMFSDADFE